MKTKGPKQDSQKIKNSLHIFFFFHSVYKKEKIEDTKGVIRSRKTKDILYNDLNFLFDFWCLMPLSAIFQLNHGDHF